MIVNAAALLRPIDGPAPAGIDLRDTDTMQRLRELRRGDDPRLPQGVWQHEAKQVDWRAVARQCGELLSTRSKDLHVAVWLVDAEVRAGGVEALAPAIDWLASFVDRWWPSLHPAADGDVQPRLAVLFWLDRELALALRTLPLTAPTPGATPLTWTDVANARRLEVLRPQDPAAVEKAERNGAIGQRQVEEAFARTAPTTLLATMTAAERGALAIERLVAAADLRAKDAPAFAQLKAAVRDVIDTLKPRVARPGVPKVERRPPSKSPITPAPAASVGAFASRDDAYATLEAVADYLAAIEPHSPTPYLLTRALAWRDLRLDEVLADLGRAGVGGQLLLALLAPGHDRVTTAEEERDET